MTRLAKGTLTACALLLAAAPAARALDLADMTRALHISVWDVANEVSLLAETGSHSGTLPLTLTLQDSAATIVVADHDSDVALADSGFTVDATLQAAVVRRDSGPCELADAWTSVSGTFTVEGRREGSLGATVDEEGGSVTLQVYDQEAGATLDVTVDAPGTHDIPLEFEAGRTYELRMTVQATAETCDPLSLNAGTTAVFSVIDPTSTPDARTAWGAVKSLYR